MEGNPQLNSEQTQKLIGYNNIQDLLKDGYKSLMEAIKYSNNLPQGGDWHFYNTHESFVKIINEENAQILKQINMLLRTNQIEGNIRNRGLEEKTELVVEANDNILERVANNIDELNGIKKTGVENTPIEIQNVSAELPVNGSWNKPNAARFSVTSSLPVQDKSATPENTVRLIAAKNIIRPQTFFKDKIVNSSKFPWEPRIKEKPNSLKPLAIYLEEVDDVEEFCHPYEFELDRFEPMPEQLQKETPVKPIPVEDTPLIEITDVNGLNELVETLRVCKEFAVDVEHHSYRTFMGITCLLQISTKEKDYLIDTLLLRDKLWILNEVFTKPTIVKIFHGAGSDIQWLQRDLSIYVVNMFDTYHAAKQLEFSGLSLAYLMQRYCSFVPNKQFQLADWRIRPLPKELKNYAREDTHYLIYIYQMLKNDLLDRANGSDKLLLSVICKSTDICKKRYFKPILKDDSYMEFYRKCKRTFDNRQLYALKELYKWRDLLSREEDESIGYVLPNHMLLQIAEALPREVQGILACCNPIPPLVRSNLLELHQIVLKAKEQPLEKPIFKEDTRARGSTKKMSKINVDSPLNCPHDLTKLQEFRDDLPTLLGNINITLDGLINTKFENENTSPICSIFHRPDQTGEEQNKIKEKLHSFKFLGPFERYKSVRPYIQAEENTTEDNCEANVDQSVDNAVDVRTDKERIETIREHFLSLSNANAASEETENRSLVQMGGTKRKRKRSPTVTEQSVSVHPVYLPVSNETSNNDRRDGTQKRKSSDKTDGATPAKKRQENIRNPASFSKNLPHKRKKDGRNFENRNRRKQQQNRTEQQNRPENPSVDRDNQEFTPFDYSSVDFRQFQGGAGNVSKPQEFKSTVRFKGKNRRQNKMNTRSATLGNKFQSRGQGRGR